MANSLNLETANKPPSPCLSSRIPYGTTVSNKRLKQIENAEYLLNSYGFNQVRVRYRNNTASIEVASQQIESLKQQFLEISKSIKTFGFNDVIIDHEGFVSGKLNRVLND